MADRDQTSIGVLLEELKTRESACRVLRLENVTVEPCLDGVKINGVDGAKRKEIVVEGPKFFSFVGVPEAMQGKLTKTLLAQVAKELLYASKNGRFSVLFNDGEPVCFQSHAAPFVPVHQAVRRVLEQVHQDGNWTVADHRVAPDHVDLDIVCDRASVEPKVGDVMLLGLHMSLYDSMFMPAVLEGYTHRLFCANGAQARYNNRAYTLHAEASSEAIVEQIAARATRLMADIPAIVERESRQLMGTPVQNPVAAINRIAEELQLPTRSHQLDRVQEAFTQEPGNTMWEVTQAFTRAANAMESYDARSSLRVIGGKLMEKAERRRCAGCYRTIG